MWLGRRFFSQATSNLMDASPFQNHLISAAKSSQPARLSPQASKDLPPEILTGPDLQKTLDALIEQNQPTREWMRNNQRISGSMPKTRVRSLPEGSLGIHIHSTRNNTIVTLHDRFYKPLQCIPGGYCQLKGAQRSSSEAGTRVGTRLASILQERYGVGHASDVVCHVKMAGFGRGREACFRALIAGGVKVASIQDATKIAHGGCKPKKQRRI